CSDHYCHYQEPRRNQYNSGDAVAAPTIIVLHQFCNTIIDGRFLPELSGQGLGHGSEVGPAMFAELYFSNVTRAAIGAIHCKLRRSMILAMQPAERDDIGDDPLIASETANVSNSQRVDRKQIGDPGVLTHS